MLVYVITCDSFIRNKVLHNVHQSVSKNSNLFGHNIDTYCLIPVKQCDYSPDKISAPCCSTTLFFRKVVGNKAKGRISKRMFQESKARQNFRKTNISYLLIRTRTRTRIRTHTYVCVSGRKKCLFFGNFGVLCFLETSVLRFPLLPFSR